MAKKALALALVLLFISVSASAEGKVEATGALTDASVPESVRSAVEQKGYRVLLDDGSVAAEIWLRAKAPTGKNEQPGTVYSRLGESTLIAVINFPKQTQDFRGQMVKAGTYTLRYSVHPSDGNHLGISPVRDFLLLIPAAADANPDAQYKFEELVKMSAKTTGTNHPAVLSLVAPEDRGPTPSVFTNDHGHTVFSAILKTAADQMPLTFIIKGIAEQ